MQNYLHLHPLLTATPLAAYREKYELLSVEYEFKRNVNSRGEWASALYGGLIKIAVQSFVQPLLLAWAMDSTKREDGALITMNEDEVLEKIDFKAAKVTAFRMHYDSRTKNSLLTLIDIEAQEIISDKNLYYQKER